MAKREKAPEALPEINLLVNPEVNKGVYSNVAVVHHTANEFLIDFILQFGKEAQLVSRVILSPSHMESLKKAIESNLERYNQKKKAST